MLQLRGAGVGNADAPAIVPNIGLVADDPDAGDTSYGVGDTLTITLTARTNRGAYAGGKDFVDSLFAFSATLGRDYTGEWRDASTVTISQHFRSTPWPGFLRPVRCSGSPSSRIRGRVKSRASSAGTGARSS